MLQEPLQTSPWTQQLDMNLVFQTTASLSIYPVTPGDAWWRLVTPGDARWRPCQATTRGASRFFKFGAECRTRCLQLGTVLPITSILMMKIKRRPQSLYIGTIFQLLDGATQKKRRRPLPPTQPSSQWSRQSQRQRRREQRPQNVAEPRCVQNAFDRQD